MHAPVILSSTAVMLLLATAAASRSSDSLDSVSQQQDQKQGINFSRRSSRRAYTVLQDQNQGQNINFGEHTPLSRRANEIIQDQTGGEHINFGVRPSFSRRSFDIIQDQKSGRNTNYNGFFPGAFGGIAQIEGQKQAGLGRNQDHGGFQQGSTILQNQDQKQSINLRGLPPSRRSFETLQASDQDPTIFSNDLQNQDEYQGIALVNYDPDIRGGSISSRGTLSVLEDHNPYVFEDVVPNQDEDLPIYLQGYDRHGFLKNALQKTGRGGSISPDKKVNLRGHHPLSRQAFDIVQNQKTGQNINDNGFNEGASGGIMEWQNKNKGPYLPFRRNSGVVQDFGGVRPLSRRAYDIIQDQKSGQNTNFNGYFPGAFGGVAQIQDENLIPNLAQRRFLNTVQNQNQGQNVNFGGRQPATKQAFGERGRNPGRNINSGKYVPLPLKENGIKQSQNQDQNSNVKGYRPQSRRSYDIIQDQQQGQNINYNGFFPGAFGGIAQIQNQNEEDNITAPPFSGNPSDRNVYGQNTPWVVEKTAKMPHEDQESLFGSSDVAQNQNQVQNVDYEKLQPEIFYKTDYLKQGYNPSSLLKNGLKKAEIYGATSGYAYDSITDSVDQKPNGNKNEFFKPPPAVNIIQGQDQDHHINFGSTPSLRTQNDILRNKPRNQITTGTGGNIGQTQNQKQNIDFTGLGRNAADMLKNIVQTQNQKQGINVGGYYTDAFERIPKNLPTEYNEIGVADYTKPTPGRVPPQDQNKLEIIDMPSKISQKQNQNQDISMSGYTDDSFGGADKQSEDKYKMTAVIPTSFEVQDDGQKQNWDFGAGSIRHPLGNIVGNLINNPDTGLENLDIIGNLENGQWHPPHIVEHIPGVNVGFYCPGITSSELKDILADYYINAGIYVSGGSGPDLPHPLPNGLLADSPGFNFGDHPGLKEGAIKHPVGEAQNANVRNPIPPVTNIAKQGSGCPLKTILEEDIMEHGIDIGGYNPITGGGKTRDVSYNDEDYGTEYDVEQYLDQEESNGHEGINDQLLGNIIQNQNQNQDINLSPDLAKHYVNRPHDPYNKIEFSGVRPSRRDSGLKQNQNQGQNINFSASGSSDPYEFLREILRNKGPNQDIYL